MSIVPELRESAVIVLAGGRSQRMGTDKALLRIGSDTFLARICRMGHECFKSVVVVAAENQQFPKLPGRPVLLRDPVPDAGPLAGFCTGLQHLQQHAQEIGQVWLACCDAPTVQPTVLEALRQSAAGADAAIVRDGGRLQPFVGLYRTAILPIVSDLVEQQERRLGRLLQVLNTTLVDAEDLRTVDPELRCLWNINTPADYQRLVEDLSVERNRRPE